MESWRKVWREGIAPLLTHEALNALLKGLETDDEHLIQGATTSPPPLMTIQDWPCECACGLGYCGWKGMGLDTVGEVEEFFARMCFEIDQRLGEPAACRWWLNFWDETPRNEMREKMIGEIKLILDSRSKEV